MSVFGNNLKLLRKRKKLSQEAIASDLGLTRSTLSGYENGTAEPSFEVLLRMSSYYGIPTDTLLKVNLQHFKEEELADLSEGIKQDVNGRNIRVLATTVSDDNEENVELVPAEAKAGYLTGYADPEYLSELPQISLPFLGSDRKYRAFPISGDSMPPVSHGAFVVCEFVLDWNDIKDGDFYVVVSKDDGIVFKQVYNHMRSRKRLQMVSTNPQYPPYDLPINEVMEVWKFVCYINRDIPETPINHDQVTELVLKLQREMSALKSRVDDIDIN